MQMQLETRSIKDRIVTLPNRPPAMLDRDLAEVYGTDTSHLNRQVKSSEDWFSEKFRFNLNKAEAMQFLHRQPNQFRPWAYTHEGCNLAAFVLNTTQAKQHREIIIEAFTAFERGEAGLQKQSLTTKELQSLAKDAAAFRLIQSLQHFKKFDEQKVLRWRRYIEMDLSMKERAKLLDVSVTTMRAYEKVLWLTVNQIPKQASKA